MPKNRTLIYLLLLLANSVLIICKFLLFSIEKIRLRLLKKKNIIISGETNYPPIFRQVNNNFVLSEYTPVGSVVYQLQGSDPEGSNVTFGSIGSEHFEVDPISGNITLIKPLDREERDSLKFLITIRDQVSEDGESELDNIVQETITIIVSDENDNAPEFQNVRV